MYRTLKPRFLTACLRLPLTPPSRILSRASIPLSQPPPSSSRSNSTTTQQTIGRTETPKLQITFTCTAPASDSDMGEEERVKCGERSTHTFTKQAYTKGIVLIQCPGCKNRHLIADHLGWFEDSKGTTVEDIVSARGERVKRGLLVDGEYVPSEEEVTEKEKLRME